MRQQLIGTFEELETEQQHKAVNFYRFETGNWSDSNEQIIAEVLEGLDFNLETGKVVS